MRFYGELSGSSRGIGSEKRSLGITLPITQKPLAAAILGVFVSGNMLDLLSQFSLDRLSISHVEHHVRNESSVNRAIFINVP